MRGIQPRLFFASEFMIGVVVHEDLTKQLEVYIGLDWENKALLLS